MLPRKQRIPKALAREIFANGPSVSSAHFLLKTSTSSPSAVSAESRFAVSISKKVAPTAVARNRTRRRVYSVIRDIFPSVKPGATAAITVKSGGDKLPYEEISKEIQALLKRAGII